MDDKQKTRTFKDLIVWKKSYLLALEIYKLSKEFPRIELYGLTQQIRRAAISIPCNIAEGYGRHYSKEYAQFLAIAYGSLCELETQYLFSLDLAYVKKNELIENLMREVGAMLYRLAHPK